MIAYDLKCANGHFFEGWFEDREAFLYQQEQKLIGCPVCNDTDIRHVPSTFAIKGKSPCENEERDFGMQMEPIEITRWISEYVEKNFDDVGGDFAKEALKMHYGVCARRNIRGYSSEQEEKTLKKEGIVFFKTPVWKKET